MIANGVDEYLKARTGEGSKYWMDRVGCLIASHTDEETKASRCDDWMMDLSTLLWNKVKPLPCYDWSKQDENIVCASLMGLILTLWSTRVIRAKSFDLRRPAEVRKGMMKRLWEYRDLNHEAMWDSSKDKEFFPLQEWECPFTGEKV